MTSPSEAPAPTRETSGGPVKPACVEPSMVTGWDIAGRFVETLISYGGGRLKAMTSASESPLASVMACLSVPGPSSSADVTVYVAARHADAGIRKSKRVRR